MQAALQLLKIYWILLLMIIRRKFLLIYRKILIHCKNELMKFNMLKYFVMSITQEKKHKIMYTYHLHDILLSSTEHCKYLGVTLQSDLKWSKHIRDITVKANSTLGLLKQNIRVSSAKLKEQDYLILVRSQLEYTSTVWSPWLVANKLALQKIQHRAVYYVCNTYIQSTCLSVKYVKLS